MKHSIDIEKYDGTIYDLSEDIGDLHYLRLKKLFILLSEKIKKDSEKDKSRGREKLSKELDILSNDILILSEQIEKTWKICKPYMKNINIQFLYKEDEKAKEKIIKDIFDIYNELKITFNDNLEYVNIRIHNSRKKLNKFLGFEAKKWVIGNVNENQEMDLASITLIEKEKYHKKEEFYSLLKHELSHLFINNLASSYNIPIWLNEGIAEYLSAEYHGIKKIIIPENFFENNIENSGWHKSVEKEIMPYKISHYFIIFLLQKYDFKDLVEFIKTLNKKYNEKEFEENFKIIFKKDFKEIKKEFFKKYKL